MRLISTLFRIAQTPGFVAARMVLGCMALVGTSQACEEGVQEIIL
jgi:hypothetical protein